MKSQINSQAKPNLTKKPSTKQLNDKKNSLLIEPSLKKDKTKPNLTINHNNQSLQTTSTSNLHKIISPKNTTNNQSSSIIIALKTQPNQELIKHQKSQTDKKNLLSNKIRKTGISKHQPIKKQFLTNLRSPRNLKTNTVQSQIFLTSKQTLQNAETQLNIQLDTSIIQTQHFNNQTSQNQQESQIQISFIKQNSTKTILTHQQTQIQELTKTSKQQIQEILKLKQTNEELQRKLNKMKDQHKKKLRERISTFNEEGEELKQLKDKIVGLEKQIEDLILQNQVLKKQSKNNQTTPKEQLTKMSQKESLITKSNVQKVIINVFELSILPFRVSNLQKGVMVDESVMTSFQDSMCESGLSSINGKSFGNLQQSLLSQKHKDLLNDKRDLLNESCYIITDNLQIQGIKSSYEQKYMMMINMMDDKYRQGLRDIQSRTGLFIQECKQAIKSQQQEILSLEKKIDQMYQKQQEYQQLCTCTCDSTRNKNKKLKVALLDMDEKELKYMMEVNVYKNKLSQKDQQLKTHKQSIHIQQINCKKIQSELDIERIKHSLNTQITILNKSIITEAEQQQMQIIKQQLNNTKIINQKLSNQNSKKEQIIKKLSTLHQLNNNNKNNNSNNNKKIKK